MDSHSGRAKASATGIGTGSGGDHTHSQFHFQTPPSVSETHWLAVVVIDTIVWP